MSIVAALVGDVPANRPVRDLESLFNRNSIHLAAKQNGPAWLRSSVDCDDAIPAHPCEQLVRIESFEDRSQYVSGPFLAACKLSLSVKTVSQVDEIYDIPFRSTMTVMFRRPGFTLPVSAPRVKFVRNAVHYRIQMGLYLSVLY